MPIQKTKLVMKKPQTMGRFNPVMPSPRSIITPMVMAAARTMVARKPTTGQNQRGVSSIDRSRSRLISAGVRALPSCMAGSLLTRGQDCTFLQGNLSGLRERNEMQVRDCARSQGVRVYAYVDNRSHTQV